MAFMIKLTDKQHNQLQTLQPDCVVQSPLRTTPNDPSPNFPNRHKSFSLIKQVKLWLTLPLFDVDFANTVELGCSVVLRFSLDDPSDSCGIK